MHDLVIGLNSFAIGVDSANRLFDDGCDFTSDSGGSGGNGRRNGVSSGDTSLALDTKSKWDDFGDVGLGAVNLDGYTKTLAQKPHSLETFLVVRTTTTNEDLDLVSD